VPPRPPWRPWAADRPLRGWPAAAIHLAWCGAWLALAALLVGSELATPCPPGGWLSLGACRDVAPFLMATVGLAAALYVGALSGVRAWTGGLLRRGVADQRAARDWYLLAAGLGLPIMPLLAFTLVSALR